MTEGFFERIVRYEEKLVKRSQHNPTGLAPIVIFRKASGDEASYSFNSARALKLNPPSVTEYDRELILCARRELFNRRRALLQKLSNT